MFGQRCYDGLLESHLQFLNVTMALFCKAEENYFKAARSQTASVWPDDISSHSMLVHVLLSTKDCS